MMAVKPFTFPFEPPMEDLRMVLKTQSGATCYVFDTFCRDITREEKIAVETRLFRAYREAMEEAAIRAADAALEKREGDYFG